MMLSLKVMLRRILAASNSLMVSSKEKQFLGIKKQKYRHDFAMLTCSFSRDMKRCFNAYHSFEKFFVDKVPYFICVPECGLKNFEIYFTQKLNESEIHVLPEFLTERELMEMAGEPVEPALALPGYYLQDALRLSFGLTGLAKHYFMNDSDGYFIKQFDKNKLYQAGTGKLMYSFHETWHRPRTASEMAYFTKRNGLGHANKEFVELNISYFDIQKMIKQLIDNRNNKFSNYTCTPTAFDSNIIRELKKYLIKVGLNNFTNIIRMIPFAFQWYGEFLDKHQELIPMPFLFFTCEPHIKTWEVPRGYFDDPVKCGVQYQSVDYSCGIPGVAHDRVKPHIIYHNSP
jgi:Family of unknown function (DUF6492)